MAVTYMDASQERLNEIMEELVDQAALSEAEPSEYVERLKSIYLDADGKRNNFRHMYSDISRILMTTGDELESSGGQLTGDYQSYRAGMLAQNLEYIHCCALEDSSKEIVDVTRKLLDHANLEFTRLNNAAKIEGRQRDKHDEMRKQLADSLKKVNEAERKVDDIEVKADGVTKSLDGMQRKMQRDYIAILGIFAAVVLAFNGGIGFASSALTAQVVQASFPHTVMVVLLIGFVLSNTIAILLGFVWKLVRGGDGGKVPKSALVFLTVLDAVMLLAIAVLSLAYMPEAVSMVKCAFGIT